MRISKTLRGNPTVNKSGLRFMPRNLAPSLKLHVLHTKTSDDYVTKTNNPTINLYNSNQTLINPSVSPNQFHNTAYPLLKPDAENLLKGFRNGPRDLRFA